MESLPRQNICPKRALRTDFDQKIKSTVSLFSPRQEVSTGLQSQVTVEDHTPRYHSRWLSQTDTHLLLRFRLDRQSLGQILCTFGLSGSSRSLWSSAVVQSERTLQCWNSLQISPKNHKQCGLSGSIMVTICHNDIDETLGDLNAAGMPIKVR